MAIAKRLTEEQRAATLLPEHWERAVRHPIIAKLRQGQPDYYRSAATAAAAIKSVRGWKGASWYDKVFVISLDILLEKAFGQGLLEPEAYNRLWEHLYANESKMFSECGLFPWQTYIWDVYHDHYGLNEMDTGELTLPIAHRTIRLKKKQKAKRRVLKRR